MPLDTERARLVRAYQVRIAAYVVTIIAFAVGAVAAPVWPLRIVLGVMALVGLLPLAANVHTYRRLSRSERSNRDEPDVR